jgi:hypothetical protein
LNKSKTNKSYYQDLTKKNNGLNFNPAYFLRHKGDDGYIHEYNEFNTSSSVLNVPRTITDQGVMKGDIN